MEVEQVDDHPDDDKQLLIGFDGREAIKNNWNSFSSVQECLDFVKRFRLQHQLHHPSIDPVINMFVAAGVSRNELAREILNNYVNIMKQKISLLDQTQLKELLDCSFRYMTVPEMASVPIAVLENLTHVDQSVWDDIVRNGIECAPYTELPISLKHRIWLYDKGTYLYELETLLGNVEPASAPSMASIISPPSADRKKVRNDVLKDLLKLATVAGQLQLEQVAEAVLAQVRNSSTQAQRVAVANLFHEFVVTINDRSARDASEGSEVAWSQVVKCGRILGNVGGHERQLSPSEADFLLLGASERCSGREYVHLLMCSTYSRDFMAEQLTIGLWHSRGYIGEGERPEFMESAEKHLRSDSISMKLATLLLHTLRAKQLVVEGAAVPMEEVESAFSGTFPLLLHEMHVDFTQREEQRHKSNPNQPNDKLRTSMTAGSIDRCVVTTYCVQCLRFRDPFAMSRYRMVLDQVASISDPVEEAREMAIANHCIAMIYQDDHFSN